MSTALDVITDAFQLLGVYGAGDTIATADQTLALQVLNDTLDVWSNESLAAFCTSTQSFQVVAGQSTYTIGSGGQINATRPIRLIDGPGACFLRDGNNNDFPIDVVPQDVWNEIGNKTDTSNIPDTLFYDPQYPLGIINLFPVPSLSGYTVFLTSYQQLGDFASVSTPIAFPPGYKRALGLNLAVELKPYFADGQLDPIIIQKAAETKGILKRANRREIFAEFDPELVARGAPSYNIYRDSRNRG